MDLMMCTRAQSYWNKKGPSANYCHKAGSKESSKITLNAIALTITFAWLCDLTIAVVKTCTQSFWRVPHPFDHIPCLDNCYTMVRQSELLYQFRGSIENKNGFTQKKDFNSSDFWLGCKSKYSGFEHHGRYGIFFVLQLKLKSGKCCFSSELKGHQPLNSKWFCYCHPTCRL